MQRQLLQIADKIPDDIMLTLLKCFAKISSVQPAAKPKVPFIRAFTRRQDSPYLSGGSSGEQSEAENECTFNLKLNASSTQEVSVSIESNEDDDQTVNQQQPESQAEVSETPPVDEDDAAAAENNVDEGIEIENEIPKVSSDDEASADEQFAEISQKDELEPIDPIVEASEPEEEYEESLPEIDDEPIPEEPPKVSLDDIERELQQMQSFLMFKGIDSEKLQREQEELKRQRELAEKAAALEEEKRKQQQLAELAVIEDTYQIDVCVQLKNRELNEQQKSNKYETYREELINEGPIIDPTVPNTKEDFMQYKTYGGGNKKKIFDMSWQNLCENPKKTYR